jgi:hypothetical protein
VVHPIAIDQQSVGSGYCKTIYSNPCRNKGTKKIAKRATNGYAHIHARQDSGLQQWAAEMKETARSCTDLAIP